MTRPASKLPRKPIGLPVAYFAPPCPCCGEVLEPSVGALVRHYKSVHGAPPSAAETFRFRVYRPKDFAARQYTTGIKRHWLEVQGGAPGMGRRK